jgi:hypothetical protein
MQQILNYSPLYTALVFLPAAKVFLVVGGWGSSFFVNHLGAKRVLLMAMALVTAGNAMLTQISLEGNFSVIESGTMLWALGASIGFPALFIVALSGTKSGEEGLASGIITTSQRVGFPLGLAVLVTVASVVSPAPIGVDPSAAAAALVHGFQYAFAAATILSVIGLLITSRIKSTKIPPNQQTVAIS